jgi:hypothetical protein
MAGKSAVTASDRRTSMAYAPHVTAAQIIHEIDSLPPAELAVVVRYTRELENRLPLSGAELSGIAQRMVNASDPVEADRLQESLVKGFFGEK